MYTNIFGIFFLYIIKSRGNFFGSAIYMKFYRTDLRNFFFFNANFRWVNELFNVESSKNVITEELLEILVLHDKYFIIL